MGTSLQPVLTDDVQPYMLVQSGGEDDAHGNVTVLETELNNAKAEWEITRYSNVLHGFTHWGVPAYNARADWRSWDSMSSLLSEVLVSNKMDDSMKVGDEDKDTMMEVEDKETMAEVEDKETMMGDEDKETMMEDENEETMMGGEDKETMTEDEDKETMMKDEDKETMMGDEDSESGAHFVGNAAAGLFSLVLTIWFW